MIAEYITFGGNRFHYRQFFDRLILYYTIKKYFLTTFFQTFVISSIQDGTETISYIRMCVCVAVRGIPLYSRNTARRHVCMYACVYTKLSNQSNFTCGWVLGLLGFDFYIFI